MDQWQALYQFMESKQQTDQYRILGPAEIEYGWGWDPTVCYWIGQRRIHIYSFFMEETTGNVKGTIEIADRATKRAKRHAFNSLTQMWDIASQFLIEELDWKSFAEGWTEDHRSHDSHVPDPPVKHTPANILLMIDEGVKSGKVRRWDPKN